MMKGAVFTSDSILAAAVALSALTAFFLYTGDSGSTGWDDVRQVRAAYDIGLAIDRAGVLSSNNDSLIEVELGKAKPQGIAAHLDVERYADVNGTLQLLSVRGYGDEIGDERTSGTVLSAQQDGVYVATVEVGLR
jgi:hypothetical protein